MNSPVIAIVAAALCGCTTIGRITGDDDYKVEMRYSLDGTTEEEAANALRALARTSCPAGFIRDNSVILKNPRALSWTIRCADLSSVASRR